MNVSEEGWIVVVGRVVSELIDDGSEFLRQKILEKSEVKGFMAALREPEKITAAVTWPLVAIRYKV